VTDYYIANHVHFALRANAAVFLDLRSDRYSMILGPRAQAFKSILFRGADFHMIDASDTSPLPENRALIEAVITELLDSGMLTTDRASAAASTSEQIPLPEESLLDDDHTTGQSSVHAHHVGNFLASCATAKWRLARSSIESIVRTVEQRKRQRVNGNLVDLRKARNLVRVYNKMRPLLPLDARCLFDSLSLLNFLAKYGCFPNWIFAVQLHPWEAHCWVQYGTVAFNQSPDDARTYLPLMSV
jgi:hypothetical protein